MNTPISAILGWKHRQLQPFLKETGEDAAVIKAGLGITLGDPIHFQLPRFSQRCPAPVFTVALSPEGGSESLWRHSQRLSFARKGCSGSWGRCWKAWASFAKDPKSAPNISHHPGNGLLLPGPQWHPFLSHCTKSCLCSCGHPFALHQADPDCSPTSTAFVFHTIPARNMMGHLLKTFS